MERFTVMSTSKNYAFKYELPLLSPNLNPHDLGDKIESVIIKMLDDDIDSLHNHLRDSRLYLSDNAAKALVEIQCAGIDSNVICDADKVILEAA